MLSRRRRRRAGRGQAVQPFEDLVELAAEAELEGPEVLVELLDAGLILGVLRAM